MDTQQIYSLIMVVCVCVGVYVGISFLYDLLMGLGQSPKEKEYGEKYKHKRDL